MSAAASRYSKVAIALHWVIAVLIIGLIIFGILMTDPDTPNRFALYQWHKSFGILVLILSVSRLFWRLGHKPPPLPDHMSGFERFAAKATHIAFYGVMIGMPLLGWALVSSSTTNIPTQLFGTIPWPHLPILSTLENKKPAEELFKLLHGSIGKATILLIALHVAAALKHHILDKDDILSRMLPFIRPRS